MKPKKLYDIHFHPMDLIHANVTAFINRFLQEGIIESFRKRKNNRHTWWGILIIVMIIGLSLILWTLKIVWLFKILSGIMLFLLAIFTIIFFFRAKWILSWLKKLINLNRLISKKNNSLNLLSFMESAIEYDFLVLEEFMRVKDPVLDKNDGSLTIGDTKFGKIVL